MRSLSIAIFAFVLPFTLACHAAGQTAAPKISSVTFSAPSPLKAGDMITVDVGGTPGVRAAFAVKGLIAMTHLKEVSTGAYHGTAVVPKGKHVRNAALIAYLGSDGAHASPVQASRLITVLSEAPAKLPPIKPEVRVKPVDVPKVQHVVKPVQPAPQPMTVAKPAPTPPPPIKERDGVTITTPTDGAAIRHVILVEGSADPGSTVKVNVTYNNGLSGVLRLSGEVASQDVAVGKNGRYKLGPIALDGPLATSGLTFTIKAYYPDRADHGTAQVVVKRL